MGMNQADGSDNRILRTRVSSPDVEVSDTWNLQSMEAPNPKSPDNFITEVQRILFMHFGYTPVIPIPIFRDPVLKMEPNRCRFMRFLGMEWEVKLLPAFETAQISAAATFIDHLHTQVLSIPADEWDLSRNNCQSVFFSTRLKALRCVGQGLFMYFKDCSTVE